MKAAGCQRRSSQKHFYRVLTTKPLRFGDGLGLSTIFGFHNPSGGELRVNLECQGTTRFVCACSKHQGELQEIGQTSILP